MTNDITKRYRIQPDDNYRPAGNDIMTVSVQGSVYAVAKKTEKKSVIGIKKINKDEYVELRTGEIKEFKKNNVKQAENLRQTFERLRALIRTNFTENGENQLFITLTYRENMQDEKQLYDDFKKFMMRLQYAYPQHKFEYIVVMEPQGRGAWHAHLMLKSDQPVLYIPNKSIREIWGHGRTSTERLKSDDVGSYYVAYFTDLTMDASLMDSDDIALRGKLESADMSKKRKKGSRIYFYPVGFKFYRTSRGIKRPEETRMTQNELYSEYGVPVYRNAVKLMTETEDGKAIEVNRMYSATHKKHDKNDI